MNQHSDNGLEKTEDKRKETRSRTRKRQIEEEESRKYRRVIAALNASDLPEDYQSKFQRDEVNDDKIQNCMDNPEELDICLSSIIPIVDHKLNFALQFKKIKESEDDRAEELEQQQQQQQQEEQQSASSSSGANKATPQRIQQPPAYVNGNIMKVKMEKDYVPIKKEKEPDPVDPIPIPIKTEKSEMDMDMENSETPAPQLKEVRIVLTRIDSNFPKPPPATANDFPGPSVASQPSASSSSPDSDSESDSDSDSSNDFPLYTCATWCDTLDQLWKVDKEELGLRIIQYLAFIHAHKFPVKKHIGFAGWYTPPLKLEKAFRLLEEKYKLIKIKDNVVHLNIKTDETDETNENPWLWTLRHRFSYVQYLLHVNVENCIPILDESKMPRSDTEEMFENFLCIIKDLERDAEKRVEEIHNLWGFFFQLGLRLLDACRNEDSYPLFSRVAQIFETERGDNCKVYLVAKNNMALILDNQDKPEEALAIYQEILPALQQFFGPDDYGTVAAKFNVGCIFKAKRMYKEALGFFRQVYESRKKQLGTNHIRTTTVLKFINEILAKMP